LGQITDEAFAQVMRLVFTDVAIARPRSVAAWR
jgi:hypothetical protein